MVVVILVPLWQRFSKCGPGTPIESLRAWRIRTIFIKIIRYYVPFHCHSLTSVWRSQIQHAVIISVKYVLVYYFLDSSILIPRMVNIDRYNP